MKKITSLFFLFAGFALLLTASACHKPRSGYNPYLHMKEKPSTKQSKADKKVIKKGNKTYKKQMESNRKHLFGRKHAPGE